jgi:hypothetical protein
MSVVHSLPTPKLARNSGCVGWYPFYAMFSEAFAKSIIDRAALPIGSTIFDPWLGVGTTTAVSRQCGYSAIGRDINPVMVTIARGRLATTEEAQSAISEVQLSVSKSSSAISSQDPLLTWFAPSAAQELRTWHRFVSRKKNVSAEARDFVRTCLFETSRILSRNAQSKNPTWRKRPAKIERSRLSGASVRRLVNEAAARRYSMLSTSVPSVSCEIGQGCSTQIDCMPSSVDFVLTSPPYCTRIDYAVTTQIELAVLGHNDDSLRQLRDQSMGTSTIRADSKPSCSDLWGDACLQLLDSVVSHQSKASRSYYYKTFLQYFSDLHKSLVEIDRIVKRSGRIIIVVQDSYYKEIHVDLALMVTEMGKLMDWQLADRLDFAAPKTMRSVNTKSRRYNSKIAGVESVLCFQK